MSEITLTDGTKMVYGNNCDCGLTVGCPKCQPTIRLKQGGGMSELKKPTNNEVMNYLIKESEKKNSRVVEVILKADKPKDEPITAEELVKWLEKKLDVNSWMQITHPHLAKPHTDADREMFQLIRKRLEKQTVSREWLQELASEVAKDYGMKDEGDWEGCYHTLELAITELAFIVEEEELR